MNKRLNWFILLVLIFGFIFLYGPMVVLVTYSFNANKLMTLWGGFSTRWYPVLLQRYRRADRRQEQLHDRRHQRHLRHGPGDDGRLCAGALPASSTAASASAAW